MIEAMKYGNIDLDFIPGYDDGEAEKEIKNKE